MLALHLLQNCMVYINTLMLEQVLAAPQWSGSLVARDLRALTPSRVDIDRRPRASQRHGPACPGQLSRHVLAAMARTRRAMTVIQRSVSSRLGMTRMFLQALIDEAANRVHR